MNVKRWLLWVCLALLFASQVLLFHANQQATTAQADARDARQQMKLLQAQLDQLNGSSLGEDNARLRQESQSYAQKLAQATNDLAQVKADRDKVTGQLATARQALMMQQNHLQQLTVQTEEAQAAALAPKTLSPDDAQTICIQNLRQIETAKQQWALDNSKDAPDVPTAQDLAPYLKGGALPVCPAGGVYTIGAMNEAPACTVAGHVLP